MHVGYGGGKFYAWLTDCVIEHSGDSGLYLNYVVADVRRCILRNNTAAGNGGGIIMSGNTKENLYFRNCLIYGNHADRGGAAAFYHENVFNFENCTIVHNTATTQLPGIYRIDSGLNELNLINTILYYHTANYDTGVHRPNIISNCCTMPITLYPDAGNTDAAPGFVDDDAADYHLAVDSPCVNWGQALPWMDGATDLEGNPRIDAITGRADMGCYEYVYRGTMILVR